MYPHPELGCGCDERFWRRWCIAERTVWSDLIVFPTPALRQHLCLGQRREDLPVEEFVPEFPVEAFDVAVLPRTSRLDEHRLDSQLREPFPDGFGDELGPVIRSDVFRDTVVEQLEREGFRVLSRVALGAGDLA